MTNPRVRYSLQIVLVLAGVVMMAGCGDRGGRGADGKTDGKAPVYVGEGQLDILAWPGFAEWRSDDGLPPDWMRSFEKATSCEVHMQRAPRSGQLLELSAKDGIDLIIASGEESLSLIQAGRVQPIDPARIPALGGVFKPVSTLPAFVVDGVRYGVPFQWQAMSIQFDPKAFGPGDSGRKPGLRDLFEAVTLPDGRSNIGRVAGFAQPMVIADAALFLKTARPELAIDDPYALDETQYAAALDAVRAQHGLQAVPGGPIAVSGNWYEPWHSPSDPALSALHRVRPDGDVTGWADASMLHAKAKHPNCALAWMQWSLQAKTQALVADTFGTSPATMAACTGSNVLGQDWCAAHGVDAINEVHFWRTPTARCGNGKCVPYSRWVNDSAAIRNTAQEPPAKP